MSRFRRSMWLGLVLGTIGWSADNPTRERVLQHLARMRAERTKAEDWHVRREAVRRGFLQAANLWPPPVKQPLHPVKSMRREHTGYTVENVAMETLPGIFLPGNLYSPPSASGSSAAILVPHGHFRPHGRFSADQQRLCAHLAQMGAMVFSYAMVGWNDFTQTDHEDPWCLTIQTWNSIRALDYLCSLPHVDPKRLGVTGASGGGTQSVYLALLDDRVHAVAPVVIVYPWTEADGCKCEGGLPVMHQSGSNIIEFAALIAPRPQLIVSVGGDYTRDFPKVGFPFVKQAYAALGNASAVESAHFPTEEHDLGPSKRQALYKFFARELQLRFTPEDPATISIESPETLRVFHDGAPLPKGAVNGRKEVQKLLASLPRLVEAEVADGWTPGAEDEDWFVRPPGTTHEGEVGRAPAHGGQLRITVRDEAGGPAVPCRISILGPDGKYYFPPNDRLAPYRFTEPWPAPGHWGNRIGKGPYRYLGRFFYAAGPVNVRVPPGECRIEVAKGFERRPQVATISVVRDQVAQAELILAPTDTMVSHGYYSGDPHLHFPRATDQDEQVILDLLEAEDIRYGAVLAYNDPPGPYDGRMTKLASPQMRGLGKKSEALRRYYHLLSGQEYRSSTYGHLNLYLIDRLIAEGKSYSADYWPVYGDVVHEVRRQGGISIHAHGGYAQEIYADAALGRADAVELLQFGAYRGIGLSDWYRILNCGVHLPCVGASDYPACRWLGDCRTYVYHPAEPSFEEWLRAATKGTSFVTTGPLLLLEVDGKRPGEVIERAGPGPHRVRAKLRYCSRVAELSSIEWIVNGEVRERTAAATKSENWQSLERTFQLDRPGWIAVRAIGRTPGGLPNAEAHTNPVTIRIDGASPFDQRAIDEWLARIDEQIAVQKKRRFAEKSRVLDYFQQARDALLARRAAHGKAVDSTRPALAWKAGETRPTEAELRDFLKPTPCPAPEEMLRTFEALPGFTVDLAAAEPLVRSPIAGAIDADGHLYVAEMRDYPYKPAPGKEPLGSVRLLKDTDGDGRFDTSTIFADRLLWPGGIACWKGGVFVTAPPDLWYFKDNDGDGRADTREKVFTGFGTENQQAIVNNLIWGLDHKIYGATAGNGGAIQRGNVPKSTLVPIHGRDFRFDPRTLELEPITGTVQFGNAFDDWGNRFVCDESEPIKQIVLPLEYMKRNPYYVPPATILDLTQPPVPIFRISPAERWRQIRSSRRIAKGTRSADSAGASHHVIDAAAGLVIYRGGAFGAAFDGNMLVGDGQNNLIHRRALSPRGIVFQTRRVDERTEFLRSPSIWFRPVNLLNAPDGSLLCLDMCREYLESVHIPLDVVKHLDLTSGRDRGRVWRIRPTGRSPRTVRLANQSSTELVRCLASESGALRDTAHRLLFERQDRSVVPLLEELAHSGATPQARLHALWTLAGMDSLSEPLLRPALSDPDPHVRQHAVRLAEPQLASPAVLAAVLKLAKDPDERVAFQVALSLGETAEPRAADALMQLAQRSADGLWLRSAVLSSSARVADRMLADILRDAPSHSSAGGLISPLAQIVGARGDASAIERVLAVMPMGKVDPRTSDHVLLAMLDGAVRGGHSPALLNGRSPATIEWIRVRLDAARKTSLDARASEANRVTAIRLTAIEPFADARPLLESLLSHDQPPRIQSAALATLRVARDGAVATIMLDSWRHMSPPLRGEIADALLSRLDWTRALLDRAEAGTISLADIGPVRRAMLLEHRDTSTRARAQRILGATTAARDSVIARYRPAVQTSGEPTRGKEVYKKICANCHRVDHQGFKVGPDLSADSVRDADALLVHVLDPNRHVHPEYTQYVALDKSGGIHGGILIAQTSTSITLGREQGAHEILLRSNLEELTSTGKSLMPEGLEQSIAPAEMADLFAYLRSTIRSEEDIQTRDFGTQPGLVEPSRP